MALFTPRDMFLSIYLDCIKPPAESFEKSGPRQLIAQSWRYRFRSP